MRTNWVINRRKLTISVILMLTFWSLAIPVLADKDPLDEFSYKISPVLRQLIIYYGPALLNTKDIPVIVQYYPTVQDKDKAIPSKAKKLPSINGYASKHNGAKIKNLLKDKNVRYVTIDAALNPHQLGGVTDLVAPPRNVSLTTIGADQANSQGFTGQGVTVAVFDSGIYPHPDLAGRIVGAVDATSGVPVVVASNIDGYGHGTHVAGIIGGNGTVSGGLNRGVASNVRLLDVKVIDDLGGGTSSSLINAIDWVVQNKNVYNVRVANFSLGHSPIEGYRNDPVCQAVERLIAAGVTVIASSGNLGKDATHAKIWGAIDSPGNDPAVITVYPVNTRDTATHSDDIATTYGSRGPTYLDNLFKPDISAPGNRIVSLLSPGCRIAQLHPDLIAGNGYLNLSGSSMATPYVSGTVALMLQANSGLNPKLVKLILGLTAIKLQNLHMLEQGNGMVNALTSVQFARQLDTKSKTQIGTIVPYLYIDGEKVWAGGAFSSGKKTFFSTLVNASINSKWGSGVQWSTSIVWADGTNWTKGFLSTTSVVWADDVLWSDEGIATVDDGVIWSDGIIWVNDTPSGDDGVIWSDSVIWADDVGAGDPLDPLDGVIWTDSFPGDPR
jgi:serine protease AprX